MNSRNPIRNLMTKSILLVVLSLGMSTATVTLADPAVEEESNLVALKNVSENMRHAAYLMENVAQVPQCSELIQQVNEATTSMNYSGGSRQRFENIANQIDVSNCACSTPPRI